MTSINVEEQFIVFGASGASFYTALAGLSLLAFRIPRQDTNWLRSCLSVGQATERLGLEMPDGQPQCPMIQCILRASEKPEEARGVEAKCVLMALHRTQTVVATAGDAHLGRRLG